MLKPVRVALLLLASFSASAQEIAFSPPAETADEASVAAAMADLADKTLAAYHDEDPDQYRNRLFRLQTVAGRYAQAQTTIAALRELRGKGPAPANPGLFVQYEIYAEARVIEQREKKPFDAAFGQAFDRIYARLDDKTALQAVFSFHADLDRAQSDFDQALALQTGKSAIALPDALELLRKFHFLQAYRAIAPRADALVAQDDQRRYLIDETVLVPTPDGAKIAAMVVRPRVSAAPLPTLFEFTIYANDLWAVTDAKRSAANGYAGVVAYTRGKGRSPDAVVPYEHDGKDAAAVIDWIARQPWSDGRVGMYGGSYNGFTTWAAVKQHPPALKAIMDSATVAPGVDVPMQGNVFLNFLYPWVPYTTNTKTLDDASYNDQARWTRLNRSWYSSGQSYRALDTIDGTPSPVFRRWLEHPDYDSYWQDMVPAGDEFAAIDIPVLTTTGYYDGGMVGALFYLNEQLHHNPRADHSLVIGPYEHLVMQNGVARNLYGYTVDPVALIDHQSLRYEWFDYIFKGGPKPALLQDRINYQVMGTNEWKHASTLAAMAPGSMRLHFLRGTDGKEHRLSTAPISANDFIAQTVDFADRSNIDYISPPLIINPTIDTNNGLVFATPAFTQATEISGLFSGRLDFTANKKDFDFNIALYEQLPEGGYLQLSSYIARASYATDRRHRRLLVPGKRQQLSFTSERLTSRLLQPGSRLIAVLSINKQPDIQINYGTGRDVSDETIADAKTPLQLRWYGGSYLDIPAAAATPAASPAQ